MTMNQRLQRVQELSEVLRAAHRGTRRGDGHHDPDPSVGGGDIAVSDFAIGTRDRKGANDLLTLTQPAVIATFIGVSARPAPTSSRPTRSIRMRPRCRTTDLSRRGDQLARPQDSRNGVADEISAATGQTRFVAGTLGRRIDGLDVARRSAIRRIAASTSTTSLRRTAWRPRPDRRWRREPA